MCEDFSRSHPQELWFHFTAGLQLGTWNLGCEVSINTCRLKCLLFVFNRLTEFNQKSAAGLESIPVCNCARSFPVNAS